MRRVIWCSVTKMSGGDGGIETAASAGIFMLFAYLCGCQEGARECEACLNERCENERVDSRE